MFTTVLIALAALVLVAVVVHEIRSWRRPGHHIAQNAPMDDTGVGHAHLLNHSNIHNPSDFGGMPGGV